MHISLYALLKDIFKKNARRIEQKKMHNDSEKLEYKNKWGVAEQTYPGNISCMKKHKKRTELNVFRFFSTVSSLFLRFTNGS